MDHAGISTTERIHIGTPILKSQNVPVQKTEIVRKTHKKSPQTYTQTGLTTRYGNRTKTVP